MKERPRQFLTRTLDFWLGSMDPIRIETFRVLLGLCLLLYIAAWWHHAQEWLTPMGFHLSTAALRNYAPALPLLPPSLLPWFGLLLFGSIGAFVLGWKLPWTTWVVLGCVTYVTFADILSAYTINSLFIVSLFILALNARERAWPVRVLQATLLIQYFTSGWAKIHPGDWLKHSDVLWTQVQGWYRTDFASWLLGILPMKGWALMQYGALSFELLSPLLFVIRPLRKIAFLWGVAFHLMIALTMHLLIFFSLQMLCFYILFVEPETLHRLRAQVEGKLDRG